VATLVMCPVVHDMRALSLHDALPILAAYCAEPSVAHPSDTETFAALRPLIDNWPWQGVPFYLRTGKRMTAHVSEISVTSAAMRLDRKRTRLNSGQVNISYTASGLHNT